MAAAAAPTGAAAATATGGAASAGRGKCGCCLPSSDPDPNGKNGAWASFPFPSALPPPLRYWWARLERAAGGPKRLRALLLAYMGVKFLIGLAVLWTYSSSPASASSSSGATTTEGGYATTTPLPYRLASQGAKATGMAVGVISGSGPAQTRRVRLLQETWATSLDPRTDALLVFSDATDPALPSVGVKGTGSTWAGAQDRYFPALSFLHRAFPNASWYVLVDDDTFLVPRNLRAALARRDAGEAWYLGRTMFVKQDATKENNTTEKKKEEKGEDEASQPPPLVPFGHGGSGVCLSRRLMSQFGPHLHQEALAPTPACHRTGYGDGDLAVCLQHHLGVTPTHEACLHSGGPWATEAEATLDGALLGGAGGGGAGPTAAPCSFHQILRRQGDESPGAGRADGGEDEQVRAWHRQFNLGEGGTGKGGK